MALLLIDCPDQPGLIHAITGVLGRRGANIVSNHEFVDREAGRFFMRTEFVQAGTDGLVPEIEGVLPGPAVVRLARERPDRIVIMATREPHCLGELLVRQAVGDLGASIEAVVSNHATLAPLVERFGVPFHHVPHAGSDRAAHESAIESVLGRFEFDYLVLAKYMRILSDGFVARYAQRLVNIHHSFLPAFSGAQPYRQAFHRGVKIIGATAHFVTPELDEGPIIAQGVLPIDHSYEPERMAEAGRDVEKIVLARALRLLFEERVFLSGGRTIVFE